MCSIHNTTQVSALKSLQSNKRHREITRGGDWGIGARVQRGAVQSLHLYSDYVRISKSLLEERHFEPRVKAGMQVGIAHVRGWRTAVWGKVWFLL